MAQGILWRVNYSGKHIGTVAAPDERSALAEAAKHFNITTARRDRISVVELDDRKDAT
jgi:1,2-phenylacetyl-CoA epoxidase PaaB subunit